MVIVFECNGSKLHRNIFMCHVFRIRQNTTLQICLRLYIMCLIDTFLNCCSVGTSCLIPWNAMDCSKPGFSVPHHLPEFAQVHVHCIGDAIQPSHPLAFCLLYKNQLHYKNIKKFCLLSNEYSVSKFFTLNLNCWPWIKHLEKKESLTKITLKLIG